MLDAYYQHYNGDDFEYFPYKMCYVLQFKQQLQVRLKGIYLQQVVDTSFKWEQDTANWGATYSGDTLDCQAVCDLHAKHQMKTDLSNTTQGKIYLIYSVSSDSHSMYTFDYACKLCQLLKLCQQFSLLCLL